MILYLPFTLIGSNRSFTVIDDRNMISKLREDLLVNRNYDRMARPVVNSSKTVLVEIVRTSARRILFKNKFNRDFPNSDFPF